MPEAMNQVPSSDQPIAIRAQAREFFRRRWPALLLVSLVVTFLGDCWFYGQTLAMRDFFIEYQPYMSRFSREVMSGTACFWDSARQCGIPRMAQPAETPFYLPGLVFALAESDLAAVMNWSFHLVVAAVSAYALARQWRINRLAAVLSAVAFTFNTYVVCFIEFQCSFASLVWLPFVILMIDRIVRTVSEDSEDGRFSWLQLLWRQRGNTALLSIPVACQLFTMGEYFYYSAVLSALFWAGLVLRAGRWRVAVSAAICIAIGVCMGIALALPQLVMTLELLPLSDRAGEVDAIVSGTSAHPRHWLTLLLPFLYGRPGYPAATWAPDIYEIAIGHCYVGVLPLILACFAIVTLTRRDGSRDRKQLVAILTCIGVIGLLMAAGKFTPVYGILHAWLPGLKHFRMPTKFYLYVAFALSMLAGIGLDSLMKAPAHDRLFVRCWRGAAAVAMVVVGWGFIAAWSKPFLVAFMGHPGEPTPDQIRSFWFDEALAICFFFASLAVLSACMSEGYRRRWGPPAAIAVTFLNLLMISRQMHPTAESGLYAQRAVQLGRVVGNGAPGRTYATNWNGQQWLYGKQERIYWDWARNAGISAHVLMEGASRVTPNGLGIRRYSRMFGAMLSGSPQIQNRIADMMGVRFVITGPSFQDVYWGGATTDITVMERSEYLPRARLVERWTVVPDENAAFAKVVDADFDAEHEGVVEMNDTGLDVVEKSVDQNEPPSGESGTVADFQDEGDRITMMVKAPQRSLLVLADTWYPGWMAKVDGVTVPIHRTNYLFRGLVVESGEHRVEFEYQPPWLMASLLISGCVTSAIAGLAIASRVKGVECAGQGDTARRRLVDSLAK